MVEEELEMQIKELEHCVHENSLTWSEEKAKLERQIKELAKENTCLQDELTKALKECTDYSESSASNRKKIVNLDNRVHHLEEELRISKMNIASLTKKLESAEEQIIILHTELDLRISHQNSEIELLKNQIEK